MENIFCYQGLTIWGIINGNEKDSMNNCITHAENNQLINCKSVRFGGLRGSYMSSGRCGIIVLSWGVRYRVYIRSFSRTDISDIKHY